METQVLAQIESFSSIVIQLPVLLVQASHLNFVTQDVIQQVHQECRTFDEASIVSCQSAECSYLSVGLWHRKLFNGMHILFTWANPFTGDMMHKVHYLHLEE